VGLKTTPSTWGPNINSQDTNIYLAPNDAHAGWSNQRVLGQDTWYHVRVRFPADYQAVTGDWNYVVAWHDDSLTSSYGAHSIAVGVWTDYPEIFGAYGQNPRLVLRPAGGSSTSPTYKAIQLPPNSLLRDHWYDLLFHFVWHTEASIGYYEWWVDGTRISGEHFPTLYTNPDGSSSYNSFDLLNYHWKNTWTSEVDFDEVAIGPSRASVGG
jgi:hypothetical protein